MKRTNKEAIKHLEDVALILKSRHMCKSMGGNCSHDEIVEYREQIESIKIAIEALEDIEKLSKSKEFLRTIAKEISYEKLGDYANDRYDRGFNAAIDMCASIILEAIIGSEEE